MAPHSWRYIIDKDVKRCEDCELEVDAKDFFQEVGKFNEQVGECPGYQENVQTTTQTTGEY